MKWLALAMMMLGTAAQAQMTCTTQGNVTNCQSKGNLAPTQKRGCITLEQADPSLSPADLSLSVLACAKKNRTQDAAELYLLMLARGKFDTLRVADKTAHQGLAVLQMQINSKFSARQRAALQTASQIYADRSGPAFADICRRVLALGVPSHDPGYMIAHGMDAVMGKTGKGNDIVKGFKPKTAWREVQRSYMKCKG